MIITLISKIIGFARDVILSYYYGASNISDAYLISLTIPSVIFGLIGTGIVTAYIPMQSRVVEESGDKAGSDFTSNFLNIVLILVLLFFLVALFFTESLVKLFAIGFTDQTFILAVNFTRISLVGMFFASLVSIFGGYLQIKGNYIIPALVGIPLNFIVIISIIMSSKGNYIILALGTLLATASQFVLMLPFIKKAKFNYKLFINIKDHRIIKTLHISVPVILGTSVNQINVLVDRTIASSLAVGGISALNYANKLNLFIQGLFVTSIITVIYPVISSYASKYNFEGIKKSLIDSVIIITIFVMPITVGAMVFSTEIVSILFGRGAFDLTATSMTSSALFFYAFGMLGFGLREVLSRGFYSLQDTKTPMFNAAIGMVINILLNIIFSRIFGVGGLALATSISAIFTTALLFFTLQKKIGAFGSKYMSIVFLKILTASIIMGIIAKTSNYTILNWLSPNLSLVLSIIIGVIVYFVLILMMKIQNVEVIFTLIKHKLLRVKNSIRRTK